VCKRSIYGNLINEIPPILLVSLPNMTQENSATFSAIMW